MADDELSIADALPQILWTQDSGGNVLYFNRHWTAYTGLTLADTLTVGPASTVHPGDRDTLLGLFKRARETSSELEASYRLRRHDGEYRWHQARIVPLRREGDRVATWVGVAIDVHEQRELAMQRQYLVDATRVLGTSLELDKTLADVARLLVPHVADWCGIDLLGDDGMVRKVAVAHVDPAKVELAWELDRRNPPDPDRPTGIYHVIRTRQPEVTREITDDMLIAALKDPELLRIYRELGLRSAMVVPLVARDRVIGTLSLVSAETRRLFGDSDLIFAMELAARIAVAVDNARLYGEATSARAAAEAIAEEMIEQSRAVEAAVLEMRQQRDEAVAREKAR